ncbi:hypothetical protein FB451DRAFT_486389 [Mycena latifolia]|nr:hypothetical protein FB451DRAFT_486389 [Mycena latifolia]
MRVTGTLHSGVQDVVHPRFRTIHFEDGPAQVTVVTLLRHAWTAEVPSADIASSGVAAVLETWMTKYGSEESQWGDPAQIAQNHDNEDVGSEWRQRILYTYNHLFYDIGDVLPGVNDRMGRFHPPNHTSFVIDHESTLGTPTEKTFDTNIILLPAFLDSGVTVSIKHLPTNEGESEVELGSFSSSGPRRSRHDDGLVYRRRCEDVVCGVRGRR